MLHMKDYLTISKSDVRYPKKSTDSKSLLVKTRATHAAYVNGNWRFYRPDSVQKACHTWVPDNMARKPVIVNHVENSDVLGRVIEAKYVDESYLWSSDYPTIKDSLFYKTDGKKVGLFESVDWIVDNLAPIKGYTGLGYIELGLKISNPEAIEKVLRDEYLTVSVGFTTDSAICSICHQDWAVDDRCEHAPGEKFEDKTAFLICGPKAYDEVSFVNFPADPFASVISKEVLQDNLNKIFFLGQNASQRNSNLTFSDSLFTDDITHHEGNMDNLDVLISEGKFDDILVTIKSETLDAEQASSLKAGLHEWNPETDELKTKKRSLVSTLNAQIRKKDLNKNVDTVETVDPEVVAAITDDADGTVNDGCPDGVCGVGWNLEDLTDPDDKAFFQDEEGIYAELEIELAEVAKEQGISFEDAKLSTTKRKELKGGTFCGPNRSFPVPDCAHVTAARRLIGRAKVSADTKARILSCVSGKAKTLKCAVKSEKDTISSVSDKITGFAGDKFKDTGKEVLAIFTELDKAYDKAEPELKSDMRSMLSALSQDWYADDYVNYAKSELLKKDMLVISKQDLGDKEDALNTLSDEAAAVKKSLDGQKEINKSLLDVYKKSLATQIVVDKITKGQEGYVDLDAEARKEKVRSLAKRHVEYLKDTVNDILAEAKFIETPEDSTLEVGHQVSDNASIGAPESTTQTAMTDTKNVVVAPEYLYRQERTIALLTDAYEKAKLKA